MEQKTINKLNDTDYNSITAKLLGNIALLMLFWWILYIITYQIDMKGADFVATLCGILGFGWVLYNLIYKVNEQNEKVKIIRNFLASQEWHKYVREQKKLTSGKDIEDADYRDYKYK